MKKQVFMLAIALCFVTFAAHAQTDILSAPVDENGTVTLPTDKELAEYYSIDISHMDFETEMKAVEFFRELSTDTYFFRPVLSKDKAYLYIKSREHPEWSISQWNSHLAEKTAEKPVIKASNQK